MANALLRDQRLWEAKSEYQSASGNTKNQAVTALA